ncbi:4-hydroxybenzoate polyprenyltransferase [Desulfarculus baarsii DSM 2075]|uniref:4-hydroxybenzoate polyprenyltransferase n=1 Tax=Desulfarculus baarsii (strain ATCC 33931 / DSM 2075 / LMG 7858 / VKM B-1802 / 2st14) TaxID=644282 RepID=E1QIV3_DESB2|nr:4-hydroxybenzoate octaprenyltransferase [Desulfarculus baarsii]ADK84526.1 4-hydroxybenzoate polyprenyltransferase [Desulfarculus baarsii DSM 2075]
MKTSLAFARIKDFGELVKFSHTVFLFPFALSAVVLAMGQATLTWAKGFWIVVALVAARSAAMVINRIADLRYDAQNPRTAARPMVSGRVSKPLAWAWLIAACAAFVLASAMLGPACLYLSPVALAWVLGYSFAKRFTFLCHIWLGLATALAPLGAWVAMTGALDWPIVLLALAVACWVGGFDIIYACQDIDFDRAHKLHSLPARLGLHGALWISRGLHLLAALGFWALGPLFGLGRIYLTGVALIALLLLVEHVLVAVKRANIPMAFFTVNGVVSIAYFLFLLIDRLASA